MDYINHYTNLSFFEIVLGNKLMRAGKNTFLILVLSKLVLGIKGCLSEQYTAKSMDRSAGYPLKGWGIWRLNDELEVKVEKKLEKRARKFEGKEVSMIDSWRVKRKEGRWFVCQNKEKGSPLGKQYYRMWEAGYRRGWAKKK